MTTFDIRQYIHESNLIEGYDNPLADNLSFDAWVWLNKQPVLTLSPEIICQLQKKIVAFQADLEVAWRGQFRKIDVRVGNYACPDPKDIGRLMRSWLSAYTFTHPHTSHVEFEKIHPFVDGNGRTGRILMWWLQVNRGETPTLILNSKKQDYYKWFNTSDK